MVFALPQLVGNVLQSLNGSINAIWVGQLLGDEALAATANANIIMFLLFALVFGFGMAATVRIGQAWGRHDVPAARRTLGTALGLTGMIALVTTVLGMVFAPQMLDLLATPGPSRAEALAYLRVVFIANPMATVTTMIAMGLRGAGDAGTPLRFKPIGMTIDYLRGGKERTTYARGRVTKVGSRVATVIVEAWQEEGGPTIAAARSHMLLERASG